MNTYFLQIWRVWDFFYYYSSRLQYVEPKNNLFRIVILPYWGQDLITKEGIPIRKGDLIVKLHIHNFRLAELLHTKKEARAFGILILRELRNSLPGLAQFIVNHPRVDEIRGLVGTTFLHRGAESLGFTTALTPTTKIYKCKTWYLKWMMRLMHPDGKRRIQQKEDKLTIKRVYISKEALLNRYLQS